MFAGYYRKISSLPSQPTFNNSVEAPFMYGCSYPIYEIQNKLNALATFNVTGNEAKRNVVRSLAKGAGVDPAAAFKAGSTSYDIYE